MGAKIDADLLETLTFITEYPAAIKGDFDPAYLELPAEVLTTVMRHHQKYFSCEDADGALAANFVAVMNAYQIPNKDQAQGVPVPVLIWGVVALLMSFLVHRTRFGRYIFAMGGNPDAAALVGIPVRRVTMLLFLLLAVLTTVAAIVSISRLNAGTNSLGNNQELLVIAATVIGGTALAGGSGTILGSVLGALIMQCIDSGMLLLDVSIGTRYIVIGQVLIAAVVFDVAYRKWTGDAL